MIWMSRICIQNPYHNFSASIYYIGNRRWCEEKQKIINFCRRILKKKKILNFLCKNLKNSKLLHTLTCSNHRRAIKYYPSAITHTAPTPEMNLGYPPRAGFTRVPGPVLPKYPAGTRASTSTTIKASNRQFLLEKSPQRSITAPHICPTNLNWLA